MTLFVNHTYKGHLWCGIGALSAATGLNTATCKETIKALSLRKYIKAVSYEEMSHALVALGKNIQREYYPRNFRECPTLKEWVHSTYRKSGQISVICITGHWIVVKDDEWVCSMNHKARHVDDCPYLAARVRHVIKFQSHSGS
jgi:hypothetical protein